MSSTQPYCIVAEPRPDSDETRRAADLMVMALSEAGYPPVVLGYTDEGEAIIEPVPVGMIRRAQELVAPVMGWGLRERGAATEGSDEC